MGICIKCGSKMIKFTNVDTGEVIYECLECKVDKGKKTHEVSKMLNRNLYKK
jgi:hypothetical protein